MKLTRRNLMKLIQEYVYLPNQDTEAIMNIRKTLSAEQKKKVDSLAAEDPEYGTYLGGAVDHYGPEHPLNFDIGEPDWNASDVPFMLETILDDLGVDTSIDEIAQTLNNDWGVNQQYTRDLLTPLDDKGDIKRGSYVPVMNKAIHYRLLKKWLYEQLENDDRFNLFKDGTLQIKPDYTDYGY